MADIIPVRIRTARKQHPCDSYPPCRAPIMPGDRYEHHCQPPGSYEWGDYDHWVEHKIHAPGLNATVNGGPTGCEIAAAYQEHQRRTLVAAGLLREEASSDA